MQHVEVSETEISDADLRALLAEYSELATDEIRELTLEQVCAALTQRYRERDRLTDEIDAVISEYGTTTEVFVTFHPYDNR